MQTKNNTSVGSNNIFEGNSSFVIKINLDKLDDINNITDFHIPFCDIDEIIYMNKSQYSDFVLNHFGTFITKFKTGNNCSICCSPLKYTHKLYKLNQCNHVFHSKCIKQMFKYNSNNLNSIYKCPLCRLSNESFI